MGRRPTKHLNLPPGMRQMTKGSGKIYYYLDKGVKPNGGRNYAPLGADFIGALRKYAELRSTVLGPSVTLGEAMRRFQIESVPGRPLNTQKDIVWSLKNLFEYFDKPPVAFEHIKPLAIRKYLTWRANAPSRANKEIAWFSVIWNWSRDLGLTDAPNPCAGIKRHKEKGRNIYLEDNEFKLLYENGGEPLRDAMDLAYLLSLRPIDACGIRETDIRNGAIEFTPTKTKESTGQKLRFVIEEGGELDRLIKRIRARKAQIGRDVETSRDTRASVRSLTLLVNEKGQSLTKSMLRKRFEDAREAAAKAAGNDEIAARLRSLQFRDLRAKAATDKTDSSGDIYQAQKQLGHSSVIMTQHYVRARKGEIVKPTK